MVWMKLHSALAVNPLDVRSAANSGTVVCSSGSWSRRSRGYIWTAVAPHSTFNAGDIAAERSDVAKSRSRKETVRRLIRFSAQQATLPNQQPDSPLNQAPWLPVTMQTCLLESSALNRAIRTDELGSLDSEKLLSSLGRQSFPGGGQRRHRRGSSDNTSCGSHKVN